MKAKFLKTGYGLLAALLLTTQLIAAPIALTALQAEQPIAEGVVAFGECVYTFCS